MRPILDTHFWIWWLTGSGSLTDKERGALNRLAADDRPYLSPISLWEAQMLAAKGRLTLPCAFESWLRLASSSEVVSLLPLDVEVVLEVARLPARFHGDPADRIIAATARVHHLPVATHDRKIRQSRVVRLWQPGG